MAFGDGMENAMATVPVTPPKGSKISVNWDGPDQVITIPHRGGGLGLGRYFGAIFMLVWLSVWTFGFAAAAWSALTGTLQGSGGVLGKVVLVIGLAFGEVLGIVQLYRILRPSVSESLKLRAGSIGYDSGIPPYRLPLGYVNYGDFWKSLIPKRTRVELDHQQLRSLRLRETDSGNRLTFDLGQSRIDIAPSASEIEREWLAQLLLERYPEIGKRRPV
jgi:hypothetical protein